VRGMLTDAVEIRFGLIEGTPETHALEFLSDKSGVYIAVATQQVAQQLGLRPLDTPVCSAQSNGMPRSFVNTFKRDYDGRMDLTDAGTVTAQMAVAFKHLNEGHPHSALKMRSPRSLR
jgi:putative transposase